MKKIFVFAFALYCLLLNVQTASATIYYVSPTGSDAAAGTSTGTAWKTFNKVNDFAESPGFVDGDSILFERGSTWSSTVCSEDLGNDGGAINWGDNKTITLGGYGAGGNRWIVDGDTRHIYLSDDVGTKYNISFVINDLEIQGGARALVHDPTAGLVLIALYNVTIDNFYYDGWLNSAGTARVYGIGGARLFNDITLTDSTVINTTYKPCGTPGCYAGWLDKDNHGMRISYDVAGGKTQGAILISGNYFNNHEADGIQLKDYNGYPTTSAHRVTDNFFGMCGENPLDLKSTWVRFDHNEVASGDARGGTSQTSGGISCFHNSAHYGLQPHDLEIDNNYFHGYSGSAFWINNVDDTLFHHNILLDVISIAEIANSTGVKIYNNMLVNKNTTTSNYLDILSWTRFYNGGTAELVNNTFVMPNGGLSYGIHAEDGCDVDLTNNIFYTSDADTPLLHWINASTGTITYNQYYGPGTLIDYNGTTYNSGNFSTWAAAHSNDALGDPVFVDIANYNAALNTTSPCKANGATPAAAYQNLINLDQTVYNPVEGWSITGVTEAWTGERGAVAYGTSGGGGDATPPVISGFSPSATLPGSTTETSVSVATNEPSTCQHNETGGIAYDGIGQVEFTTTGGTTHSYTKSGLSPDSQTPIYSRCEDAALNVNTTDFVGTINVGPLDNLLSASTYYSDSANFHELYPASHAYDNILVNSTGSVGGEGIDSGWIIFDLGVDYNLTTARIFGDDTNNWYCYTWKMEVSDDLQNWTTVFTGQNCFAFAWFAQDVTGNSGRYVRFTVTGNTTYHAVQFVELWLEGSPATGGEPPAGSGQGSGIGTGTSKLIYGGPESMKIR